MPDRFPDYDVLAKRDTPSWNAITRRVVEARLAITDTPRFLDPDRFVTLKALCARLSPPWPDRPAIPVAGLVDHALAENAQEGWRNAKLPEMREAWCIALAALDRDAVDRHGQPFHELGREEQDALIERMRDGALDGAQWQGMPSDLFFKERALRDVLKACYAHPVAWSAIGFGGPASPRGYVRLGDDRRDPWEAAEARDERSRPEARRANRRVGAHD